MPCIESRSIVSSFLEDTYTYLRIVGDFLYNLIK